MHIEQPILDKVNEWLTPTFDVDTQNQIKEMMTTSPKNLEESFYKNLEFGTGGMRGIMALAPIVSTNILWGKTPKAFLII
jgi:hypothetical protein